MKKILIIKTGTRPSGANKNQEDFDDLIINEGDMCKENIIVSAVYKNENLPEAKDISAVIITGSPAMVTDREPWSVKVEKYLRDIADKDIPVLGICYGHQLICQAFGGTVGYHEKGDEIGTVKIELTEEGKKDILLGVLPDNFLGHVIHSQTALEVPKGAKILARNDFEKHHAFVIHNNIWGVQFHPEFNGEVINEYVSEMAGELAKKGHNIDALRGSVKEHKYGKMLLKRFLELAVY